ncbi:MAG: tetratricopeptide repeat protein, partial [Candidatus Fermentibacteria bacterium]
KEQNDLKSYLDELEKIVVIDAAAGKDRTPRTRYLAAQAALVLAEQKFETFVTVSLVNPLEVNLRRKRELMKETTQKFNQLIEYEIAETTAAATFYLAEIYAHFSKALMTSERPQGLSPLELEEYELAIEDQAYPFEEKAITVHENNIKLISIGVYNEWVEKSLQKLAEFIPARYDKPEEASGIVSSLDTYIYEIVRPEPPAPIETHAETPAQAEQTETAAEDEAVEMEQIETSGPLTKSDSEASALVEETGIATGYANEEVEQVEAVDSVTEPETEPPVKTEQPDSAIEKEAVEMEQNEELAPVLEPVPDAPEQLGEEAQMTQAARRSAMHGIHISILGCRKTLFCTGFAMMVTVLSLLAGCASDGMRKSAKVMEPSPASKAHSFERLADGREGFIIMETPQMDEESRRDFDRAVAMLNNEEYDQAMVLLENVIEKSPGVTAPYINMAIACRHTGNMEQAEEHLKTALQLVPDHPAACNEYGLLYRKTGRFAEAREIYEKAI